MAAIWRLVLALACCQAKGWDGGYHQSWSTGGGGHQASWSSGSGSGYHSGSSWSGGGGSVYHSSSSSSSSSGYSASHSGSQGSADNWAYGGQDSTGDYGHTSSYYDGGSGYDASSGSSGGSVYHYHHHYHMHGGSAGAGYHSSSYHYHDGSSDGSMGGSYASSGASYDSSHGASYDSSSGASYDSNGASYDSSNGASYDSSGSYSSSSQDGSYDGYDSGSHDVGYDGGGAGGIYKDTAWIVAGSRACNGNEVEWDQCNDALPSCDNCVPQDCRFAQWGNWYDAGGCTGLCFRHRALATPNNECGQPCIGVQEDTKPCIKTRCAPSMEQDAMWSSWSEWGPCNEGQRERHRTVAQEASHGGSALDGPLRMVQPCGIQEHIVDCIFNEWNPWTTCSCTCGGGWHTRDRRIVRFSSGGGKPCIGATREEHPCNSQPCGGAQCFFTEWSSWNGCDPTMPHQKTRTRDVEQGDGCHGPLVQLSACAERRPADCVVGEWGAWSACDKQCDGGQMFRERKLLVEAHRGGVCDAHTLKQLRPCNEQPCERARNDCILSPWGEWSACTAQCDHGVSKRHREIQQRAGQGGEPCKGSMMEVKTCTGPGCEQKDCVWGAWDPWSGCSCSCGGGTMRRNRQVQVSPVAGGALCSPVDKSEVVPCNTMDCDQTCIDARWGEWTQWTDCSASCGYGFRARHRTHEVQASSCGRAATGHAADWEICKGTHLGTSTCGDRDGVLSAWNQWSDCSCTCFGIRERQRIIEQYHTGNGRSVGMAPLKQVEPCHPSYGQEPPSECVHHHADCVLSQWNEWSECPVTCGGGNTVRLRYIFTPASNDGRPCQASLRETKPCGTQSCGGGCVDCRWGAWSSWGACSKCGDQRFRQREILKLPNHCGKLCEPMVAKEVQNCTSHCERVSFCVWKPWTSWSECSAECGPATRLRERSLGLVRDQPGSFLFKVASDTNAGLCAGTQTDTAACDTGPCQSRCVPRDCQFSAWSPWAQPTCIGLCTRSRSIQTQNNECGQPCHGPLVSTQRCLEECTERLDCEFRAWSHWSQLDHGDGGVGGQRYRSREVSQMPKNGGMPCRGDLREVDGYCDKEDQHPVDCTLMQWSAWVGCSRTCGGGWQMRQRGIQDKAVNGGRPCLGDLSEGRPCADFACEDTDCQLGPWTAWTSCWGNGQKSRTRVVTRQASNGGQPCGGSMGFVPMKETQSCGNERVDCEVSEWSQWDACDRTCGPGQQQRHRQVQTYPVAGGLPCPVSLRELRACRVSTCNAVDCMATEWGEWGLCSVECGSGQQSRDRSIARPSQGEGQRCDFILSETRSCSDQGGSNPQCGVVNCVWGSWSAWSGCTCSCGGGQRTRNRHIAQTPQNGGAMCEPMHKEEIESCNTQSCEQSKCRDGQWGFWQEWSPCSASCTGGLRFRHRRMINEANECGKPAEGLSRALEPCNQNVPCAGDVDCQFDSWTEWSACTRSCDGIKRRSRRISVHGRGNGKWCTGATKETSPCNPDPGMPAPRVCRPVPEQDCTLSEWSQWGACDVTCGGGQRMRSRSVEREARGGGLTCRDSLSETDGCGQQACAIAGPKRDCRWSEWSQWGACNKCGGQRERFRHVVHESMNGGLACELKAAEETGKCPRKCHESMYCIWDNWESWSACSATCGTGGVRHRQRGLALKTHSEVQSMGLLYEERVQEVAPQPMWLSQGLHFQLAAAFAAGILATTAMGHFSRRFSSENLPLVSQIHLTTQEGLSSWRGREAQHRGYMPVSTADDLDAA